MLAEHHWRGLYSIVLLTIVLPRFDDHCCEPGGLRQGELSLVHHVCKQAGGRAGRQAGKRWLGSSETIHASKLFR